MAKIELMKSSTLNNICHFSVKYIINNYFILLALDGFFTMTGMTDMAKFGILLRLAGFIFLIEKLRHGASLFDYGLFIFAVSLTLISAGKNYPGELYKAGLGQMYAILFFFVGRCSYKFKMEPISKGMVPFIIVCSIGLYLYVTAPTWYLEYKLGDTDPNNTLNVLEMSRLSAFWPYPYWVSYGCGIMFLYLIINIYNGKYEGAKYSFILTYIFLISILAQQRAPLALIVGSSILAWLFSLSKNNQSGRQIRKYMQYIAVLLIATISLVFSYLDFETLEYLISKINVLQDGSGFVEDRASSYNHFFKKGLSLTGDGIGRYSHTAHSMGLDAITDNNYYLILFESGFYGFIGYIVVFIIVYLKGLFNAHSHLFEMGVISMYLISMLGANSIASGQEHNYIFWYCCGRIMTQK